MNGQAKIDFCIKALKPCAKSLSKLQYKNYLRNQNQNQNTNNNIRYNPSGEVDIYKRN